MGNKIFLIEDDVNILYSLQAKLSVDGFQVSVHTGSGDHAMVDLMTQIKSWLPDVVIVDLILPKVDGFEIIKEIKSDPALRDTIIIVFSNLSDADSRARGLNLGVDFFAVKDNFLIDEFIVSVKNILKNKDI